MTGREIDALVERWLRPDAALEREIDAVLGLTEHYARRARLVAYLNRCFVRPLF